MRRRFFRGFSAQIDLADEQYVKNEKERFVPLSVSPFRETQHHLNNKLGSEDDEEGERPPEWWELAGDLAWTATFSSLTSNTAVTEPIGVWNYAVFFCLTWHLWATQTTYDIRYYTNDWWHRVHFASQLGIYAILAGFSGSFNVAWQVDPEATEVFKGNVTELVSQAIDTNQAYLITKSFRGLNIMLFLSRMLLLAQYARVMYYRKRAQQFSSWRFLLTPLSLLFAGGVFLGCFIMIKEDPDSKSAAITQLALWGVAVLSQAIAGAFTPEDGQRVLKSEGTMAPRLMSLTVIILGEGLNAICGTLRGSMNSLGLSKTMVGQSLTMLLILYFIWLLYFDGFRIKYPPNKVLDELWLCLHFPLHLSLILLLEGIKNLFIYVNVIESFKRLSDAFDQAMQYYHDNHEFEPHPPVERLLLVLGMSWQEEVQKLLTAVQKDVSEGVYDNVDGQIWKWWGNIFHGIIKLYNENPDPEAEHNFEIFNSASTVDLAKDLNVDEPPGPLFGAFFNRYVDLMSYTGHWLVAVAGTLVLCMAILNVVQRRPKNRFAWGYSLNRSIIGVFLIVLGGVTSTWVDQYNWMTWILPTVAIGYGVAVVTDWLILCFSIQSIRLKEALSRSGIAYSSLGKGDYDPATRVDLAQLSYLPYGHEKPHRSESAPAEMYAQGPVGSTSTLYAAPGEDEKLHQGSEGHLPHTP